jgi:hypothetical protein
VKKIMTKAVPKTSAASHTYDYFKDKWDKFDVDSALADADVDTEYETGSDSDKEASANVRSCRHSFGWRADIMYVATQCDGCN